MQSGDTIIIDGVTWKVARAVRPDGKPPIYIGKRCDVPGPAQYIPTDDLIRELASSEFASTYGMSRANVCSLRRRLRVRPQQSRRPRTWWEERADDLRRLTHAEFAALHDVPVHTVRNMSRIVIGRVIKTSRTPVYLREPARSILLRDTTNKVAAAELGISEAAISRYRLLMQQDDQRGVRPEQRLPDNEIVALAQAESAAAAAQAAGVSLSKVYRLLPRERPPARRIDWAQYDELFATHGNSEIARLADCSRQTVANRRNWLASNPSRSADTPGTDQ